MQATYSLAWSKLVPKRTVAALGMLALPLTIRTERPVSAASATITRPPSFRLASVDPRVTRLKAFFQRLHCPVAGLSEDFVTAADDNQIDWRLLPSISVMESGGGKAFRNNNIFGWNNGLEAFPTLRAGIHEVAFKLGQSRLYQNRDSAEKLWLYNPDATYVQSVLALMNRISPVSVSSN